MSVLSLSEVQFVGEQSPGAKATEDILEEPTLLPVDCPRQRDGEKLSLALSDRKEVILEVDCGRKDPDDDQLNSEENDTLKKFNSSPQRHLVKQSDGVYTSENSLPKIGCFQQWQGGELQINNHEEDSTFPDIDSELVECKLSNGTSEEEASFSKEENFEQGVVNFRRKNHSSSNLKNIKMGSCLEQEEGLKLINGLCKSNGFLLSAKDNWRSDTDEGHTDEGQVRVDATYEAESIQNDSSGSHAEDGDQPCSLHELSDLACKPDYELDNISVQGQTNKSSSSNYKSISPLVQQPEDRLPTDHRERKLGLLGSDYFEQDHAVAFWVKWRGKWQTGIRCPRADCPLSTLRAKPTHERKRYIVVFFPRTRTYYWVDALLVRSVDESPEPLAYGSHRRWRKLVKDLTIPHHYIMQKLAVEMLNVSDQLHTGAVVQNARKAAGWKEFAMEASCCRDYSDLGKMLLKLQAMILPDYMNHEWMQKSFDSWVWRCKSAESAESVEILMKELVDSVRWNDVDELWNAPVQPELGPEWKTWKQEAMKLFFTSHPTSRSGVTKRRNCDNSEGVGPQISGKRLKLEVRRAEASTSQMEDSACGVLSLTNKTETTSGEVNRQVILESSQTCDPCKVDALSGLAAATELCTMADRWDQTAGENEVKLIFSPGMDISAGGGRQKAAVTDAQNESDNAKKYRQCSAFVVAKGRQCGRWANDGDIYCCVHLNAHSTGKFSKVERTPVGGPMCAGLTTYGNKCKHRAKFGSAFCKKHRLQNNDTMNSGSLLNSVANMLKIEHGEDKVLENISSSDTIYSKESGSLGEVQACTQGNLIPVLVGETLDERNCLMKKSELYNALPTPVKSSIPELPRCMGFYRPNNGDQCLEYAKRYNLYCEKHLPKFLKRARNGRSRLVSKDVFMHLLSNCSTRKQKFHLHQACELLYGFMKGSLSRQRSVPKEENMGWILAEASKDPSMGEYLLKLVSNEREKLMRIWGFSADKDKQISCKEREVVSLPVVHEKSNPEPSLKCKICAEDFSDYQKLGLHWTEVHKKEARWLFRGFACAVCMNSFTNRKVLETHVKERHGMQFLEHAILFRCMSCSSHFVNTEQLWQHVLSFHAMDFRLPDFTQPSLNQGVQPNLEMSNNLCRGNDVSKVEDGSQKFVCRFCGLRFDLLPDLGRHHQVAHMNPNSISHFPLKRGNRHLKRSRHCYPRFKKSFGTSFRFKNKTSLGIQKHFQPSNSMLSLRTRLQNQAYEETQASEAVGLGRLLESHCSDVAETLFSEIQKTKPRPSNLEILSIARSACCRIGLHAVLQVKYGILPENLFLKAAKLCSELNIQVGWHQEGFICPKGCKPLTNPHSLAPLKPLTDGFIEPPAHIMDPMDEVSWEMDECHYILDSKHWKPKQNAIILCQDVSFGKEPIPIACVIDEDLKDSLHINSINSDEGSCNRELGISMPWQGFTYVTERLIEPSLGLDTENSQLGCACPQPKCYPENCDHVYLFDNDYENAEDIDGKPMHGRFAYDERGRIILEEGCLVYECNSMCNCDRTCQNRVLQKGVQFKLEIFRTEKKGWAVRAGEAISRGTFVCEYIGEVLNDEEANRRGERYDRDGCSYLYDIDAHIDGARGLSEGKVPYVIDATKFGNVSRFINHSCSPNLVNFLVLVESMDCQLAHIGLYASRDIAVGEELSYDYRYKPLPGDGRPCHCGAPNCRGRLY